jgi:hypothetical protein
MAELEFPQFETLHLGYVDEFLLQSKASLFIPYNCCRKLSSQTEIQIRVCHIFLNIRQPKILGASLLGKETFNSGTSELFHIAFDVHI